MQIPSNLDKTRFTLIDRESMKHYEAQSKTLKNKFANNHTNSIDNFAYVKHRLSKLKVQKREFLVFILKSANFRYSDNKDTKPNIDKTFITTTL